jgi:GAF domain-containing protein
MLLLGELLVPNPKIKADNVLEEVVEQLYDSRGYFCIGIYLSAGDKVVRQCFRGAMPPSDSFALCVGKAGSSGQTGTVKVIADGSNDPTHSMCFPQTRSELVQPIKIGRRILGVIGVGSEKLSGFGSQERVLLEQVAELLARYLTRDQGKLLLRKIREESDPIKAESEQSLRPQVTRHPGRNRKTRYPATPTGLRPSA